MFLYIAVFFDIISLLDSRCARDLEGYSSYLKYLLYYYLRLKPNVEFKIKNYHGSGDVKFFLERVSLYSALKGYEGQKAAQYLASKLEG